MTHGFVLGCIGGPFFIPMGNTNIKTISLHHTIHDEVEKQAEAENRNFSNMISEMARHYMRTNKKSIRNPDNKTDGK